MKSVRDLTNRELATAIFYLQCNNAPLGGFATDDYWAELKYRGYDEHTIWDADEDATF